MEVKNQMERVTADVTSPQEKVTADVTSPQEKVTADVTSQKVKTKDPKKQAAGRAGAAARQAKHLEELCACKERLLNPAPAQEKEHQPAQQQNPAPVIPWFIFGAGLTALVVIALQHAMQQSFPKTHINKSEKHDCGHQLTVVDPFVME